MKVSAKQMIQILQISLMQGERLKFKYCVK
jgi:hypothetical protein